MPGYQQLLDRYGPKGFVVIGFKLDTMKDTEAPVVFARRLGVRYPLAVASDAVREKFGGIEGLPTTLLYESRGCSSQQGDRVRIYERVRNGSKRAAMTRC